MFATLNPNDRLLGKLYPRIAEETGFSNDIQGRRAYVAERCATYSENKSMKVGSMFRISQWFGWIKAWKEAIERWHSLLLLFAFIGVMQNYVL